MKTGLFVVLRSQKWKDRTAGLVFSSLGLVQLQSFSSLETGPSNTNVGGTAGLTATKMNHRSGGQVKPVREAIHRWSIFTFHCQKHTKVHQQTLGRTPGPGSRGRSTKAWTMEAGLGKERSSALDKRGWCTTEGGGEPPCSLTMHCRILQHWHLQLQYILHFP